MVRHLSLIVRMVRSTTGIAFPLQPYQYQVLQLRFRDQFELFELGYCATLG
jgi:hypothetical protein